MPARRTGARSASSSSAPSAAPASAPISGRAAMLGLARDDPELLALFDGSTHGPAPVVEGEPVAEPASRRPGCSSGSIRWSTPARARRLLGARPARPSRQSPQGQRDEALAVLPEAAPTPHSPIGLRLPEGFQVEQTEAWRCGPGRGPGRRQPAHLPRLRAPRPACRSSTFAPAPAARRWRSPPTWQGRGGSSPATPTAAGSRACRRASPGPASTIVETRLLDPGQGGRGAGRPRRPGRPRPRRRALLGNRAPGGATRRPAGGSRPSGSRG